MTIAPADIRLYRWPLYLSCLEIPMPQSSTLVPLPACALCRRTLKFAPTTVGWISAGQWETGWTEGIFVVCGACDDIDEELKKKIRNLFEQPVSIAANPSERVPVAAA